MKKLELAIEEAARQHMFGTIEIEFRDGAPFFLRVQKSEKLQESIGAPAHDRYNR
jgi:hypothetical protein